MSTKKIRRNLRRICDRQGISYKDAILKFYGVGSLKDLDKNLVWSLYKENNKISGKLWIFQQQ